MGTGGAHERRTTQPGSGCGCHENFIQVAVQQSVLGVSAVARNEIMRAPSFGLPSILRLEQVLSRRKLRFVFQPIADCGDGRVFGYEALMRGPDGTDLASPERLLEVARYAGMSMTLETVACEEAVRQFAALGLGGNVFINLSAPTLGVFADAQGGSLVKTALRHGIAPERIFLELTEHERVTDVAQFAAQMEVLRGQGLKLAIDDFGDGRSSLRLWSELRPEVVKMDAYFAKGLNKSHRKLAILRHTQELADLLDTPLVVEGIETPEELRLIRDLGCRFAQGYLLGRPSEAPDDRISTAALDALAASSLELQPQRPQRASLIETVESLCVTTPAVRAGDTCEHVLQLFGRLDEAHAVAVLEGERPIGLINRQRFIDRMSKPFHVDLFGRRPCALFMDSNPLRVDRYSSIESLTMVMLGENQRYLTDGFIVTDRGGYFGLGTGERLVRAVTERRIEAARLANPLTCLPGNVPITDHIRRLLDARAPFHAAYFDLNNFKPYNDLYGYWRGDEMIKLASAVLVRHCDSRCDFLGHVGGDDFVVLFQSRDWEMRCRRILDEFDRRARDLFDLAELERNGFMSEDRRGFAAFFPLTSISVGVVSVPAGCDATPEAVASSAAEAKKAAKRSGDHFAATSQPETGRSGRRFEHAAVA